MDGERTTFNLSVSLTELPPRAVLPVRLPAGFLQFSFARLLDTVFPPDADAQTAIEASLPVRSNPDLPDIYAAMLPFFDRRRAALCTFKLATGWGKRVELWEKPDLPAPGAADGCPALDLVIEPEYRPLAYAARHGYGGTGEELLAWLRQCALLYFLDKHGASFSLSECGGNGATALVAKRMTAQGLLRYAADGRELKIAPKGRQVIGRLLQETEDYIDRYEVFQDVLWEQDTERWQFASGYGADLRVEAFIAEGLDPVRAVYLLRLYDGSLDQFLACWPRLLDDLNFFNRALEPVVNRDLAPADAIQSIVEDGYAWLEDESMAAAALRSQEQIARQVRQAFGNSARSNFASGFG